MFAPATLNRLEKLLARWENWENVKHGSFSSVRQRITSRIDSCLLGVTCNVRFSRDRAWNRIASLNCAVVFTRMRGWGVGHTVGSLHDVGFHMKPGNGLTKPLDLALVALLQTSVSNQNPQVLVETRPPTTRRQDQYCILRLSAHCKGKFRSRLIPTAWTHDSTSNFWTTMFFLAAGADASRILSSVFTSTHSEP